MKKSETYSTKDIIRKYKNWSKGKLKRYIKKFDYRANRLEDSLETFKDFNIELSETQEKLIQEKIFENKRQSLIYHNIYKTLFVKGFCNFKLEDKFELL
jgi:hypothetical protein